MYDKFISKDNLTRFLSNIRDEVSVVYINKDDSITDKEIESLFNSQNSKSININNQEE